jgi:hypothetical protein
MHIQSTTRYIATILAAVVLLAGACNKPAPIHLAQEGTIYMPRAFSTQGSLSLVLTDTPQQVTFGAAYGGLHYAPRDIDVRFIIDTAGVSTYNAAHGTSYVLLPSSAYSVSSLDDTIKAGQTSSQGQTIFITTGSLDFTAQYILPVKMVAVSSGQIDSALQTTWFTISKLNNIYAGSYTTTGTRYNYNADGSYAGSTAISDTRVLSTMSFDSCSINTIANLGSYNGTVFYVRVNPDNTLEFSGYLQNDPGSPIANEPGKTSTYDPATKTWDVHYMYTNTNGTFRYMDEVWTPQ